MSADPGGISIHAKNDSKNRCETAAAAVAMKRSYWRTEYLIALPYLVILFDKRTYLEAKID